MNRNHQCSKPCDKSKTEIGDCVCEVMNWTRMNDEKGCVFIVIKSNETHGEKTSNGMLTKNFGIISKKKNERKLCTSETLSGGTT